MNDWEYYTSQIAIARLEGREPNPYHVGIIHAIKLAREKRALHEADTQLQAQPHVRQSG